MSAVAGATSVVRVAVTCVLVMPALVSCANDGDAARDDSVRAVASAAASPIDIPRTESLAHAAGGADGRAYAVEKTGRASGALSGSVTSDVQPADSLVVPTHDLLSCPRFTQRAFLAKGGGVGDVVVWLAGVARGPENDAPMRATVTLDDCRLEPRVVRMAAGGTLIVKSRDAVMSRLRFFENGPAGALRTMVALNDAGQVVPTEHAAKEAGIVAIRDDLHPWVRAYLAVTPHPFVVVTDDRGTFRFDRVPPGTYTLVTWHERFGTKTQSVTVTSGAEEKLNVELR